jgi:hypothetical protein
VDGLVKVASNLGKKPCCSERWEESSDRLTPFIFTINTLPHIAGDWEAYLGAESLRTNRVLIMNWQYVTAQPPQPTEAHAVIVACKENPE